MRGTGRRPLAGKLGFTLVEIMLVMIILAVLTAAVITNLHAGYQDLALESDTKLLSETIQAAQRYARAHRRICQLSINPRRGEYTVLQAATLDQPFHPAENLGELRDLDRGIHFRDVRKLAMGETDHERINFHPDGVADAACILLVSDSGDERMIEIQALAGPPIITR